MKTVILAGGMGTRISEETQVKPKPMVEIGGVPILVHIMKIYSAHGYRDFVLALGYKGEVIKDYFLDYHVRTRDVTVQTLSGEADFGPSDHDDWTVRMVHTGMRSMTGGRLRRLRDQLFGNGTFMLTYGDGVADVDVARLVEFHRAHGKLATVTAVHPPARFGSLRIDGDLVTEFAEKPQTEVGWINGGFFVMEPGVLDYIRGDETVLEKEPLEGLARDGELMAYRHDGFWHAMDTVRDRDVLDHLWKSGEAPWRTDGEGITDVRR